MDFEVKQVFYSYRNTTALNGISFSANCGQIVGLIGENGAGKTTIMKTIYRSLTPDRGTITLNGMNIFSYPYNNYPVSYIPDTPVFYEDLSLFEHLLFTKVTHPQCVVSIDDLLEKLDLRKHQDTPPAVLSKENRQKLKIAMALLQNYKLLIADEPFSNLDSKQIATLKTLLLEQKENNKIVLLSAHPFDMTENICDQYVFMKNGTCLAAGTKHDLLSAVDLPEDSTIKKIYLKLVEKKELVASERQNQTF